MDISINWLKDYINLDGLTTQQISHTLTDIGLEVEAVKTSAQFGETVVVGHVLEANPHPNADSLKLCKVDVGGPEPLQIVCGAPNARKDLFVCVALVGSELPGGLKIKEAKIRGEASFGMMCSAKELGLSAANEGIIELKDAPKPGTPIIKQMGLDDVILTLNVTPNRADCLGHIGVARDLAAKLHRPLKLPSFSPKTTSGLSSKDVKIKIETDRCGRFAALLIQDVRAVPSPDWLKRRVEAVGMRSIDLLVDVTNYVMLEMNQPIHAYDERAVSGKTFVIREAKDGEVFKSLDSVDRTLKDGDLLICDDKRPIGIAGVMGGLNSEIKPDTTSLILEVAYFDPNSVRATSRRLGMHTEASHRFERGVDLMAIERVAKRFAEVLMQCVEELNKNGAGLPIPRVASDVHDVFPQKPQPKLIALRLSEAKSFLASPHITQDMVKKYFDGLEFRLVDHNQDRMVFEIPSWRVDVERECDLIEEIARLQGYDKVPFQLPRMSLEPTPEDELIAFGEATRETFAALGFRETISFPFWSNEDAMRLRIPAHHPLSPSVKLVNPISDDAGLLQTTLSLALLKAVVSNRSQGVKGTRLFECGRGYFDFVKSPLDKKAFPFWKTLDRKERHLTRRAKEEKNRPVERNVVAGIVDHPFLAKSWQTAEVGANFFQVKSMLQSWLKAFGIEGVQWQPIKAEDVPFLHPGAAAYLFCKGQILGWVGELHPETTIALGLDVKEAPFLFELDLELVFDSSTKRSKVSTESFRFPPSTRDIAVLVDAALTHDAIYQAIAKFPQKKNLRSWHLFDVYQGANIPAGQKSVAWSFSFQSAESTLTDAVVDSEFKQLSEHLTKTFGAQQR